MDVILSAVPYLSFFFTNMYALYSWNSEEHAELKL